MRWFVLDTLAIFSKIITFTSAADITVIGISNQSPKNEDETKKTGDVVNININNYCSDNSVVVVKECYCVPPALCRDRVNEQIQARRKSANLVLIKCNQQEVCCFNVSFTDEVEKKSSTTPTTTPIITTTTPAPEYVTEIITSIIITNVTRPPKTSSTTISSSSMTTPSSTPPPENGTADNNTNTQPTEEQEVLNESTRGGEVTTDRFDVEIINDQMLSERLCGTRKLHDRKMSRIMTPVTTPASVGEFPWSVSILEKDSGNDQLKFGCMGSLIRSGVVLTAGNCIQREPKHYVVRAGTINPLTREAQIQPWQQNDVLSVTYHPQYVPGNGQNGVALLFLNIDFIINDYVNIICLPSNFNLSSTTCMSSATHLSTGTLQRISAKLESNETCKVQFGKMPENDKQFFGKDNSRFICASTSRDQAQTSRCGDPLVCQLPGDNKFTQVGLGLSCGKRNTPNVYHGVEALNNWIMSEISIK